MKQLLEMRSIPIAFEIKINHGKYEMSSPRPQVNVTRDTGGLTIRSTPPRIRMDTTDMRASMGFSSIFRSSQEGADIGMSIATQAAGNFAMEGNQLMNSATGQIADVISQRMQPTLETALGFSPSVPMNISVEPGNLSMQYEMDRLSFDWRVKNTPDVTYIPSSIEYTVTQYPRLEISYVGEPVYAPPSSSPDYQPSPFTAVA